MNKFFVIATASFAALAAPASAYVAKNSLQVEPNDDGTFQVGAVGAKGEADFWCAASDFVRSQNELLPSEVIYRVTPVPRPGDEDMVFSLTAPATPIPESESAADTGQMTIGLATSFCEDKDNTDSADDATDG